MKKIVFIFLIIVIMMSLSQVVIAEIPKERQNIYDEANMIAKDKMDLIKKELEVSKYNIYIVTQKSLNGNEIKNVARKITMNWGLDNDDILIILASKEKQSYLNVKYNSNPDLLIKNLNLDYDGDSNRNEDKFKELFDKHFIPYAQNQEFADGIIEMIKTINTLKIPTKTTTNSSYQTEDKIINNISEKTFNNIIGAGTKGLVEKLENKEKAFNGVELLILFIVISSLALLTITALLYNVIANRIYAKRLLQDIISMNNANMILAKNLIDQLKVYIGFTQGETGLSVKNNQQTLIESIIKSEEQSESLSVFKIGCNINKNNKTTKLLNNYLNNMNAQKKLLITIEKSINVIKKTEQMLRDSINMTRDKIKRIKSEIDNFSKKKGFTLELLKNEITYIENKIDELDEFDPVIAINNSNKLLENIQTLQNTMNEIVKLEKDLNELMSKTKNSYEYNMNIIQKESLLHCGKYLSDIKNSNNMIEKAFYSLKYGDIIEVKNYIHNINEILNKSTDNINKIIKYRNNNLKKMNEIQDYINLFNSKSDIDFNNHYKNLTTEYTENNFNRIHGYYYDFKELQKIIIEKVKEIEDLNSEEVQKYKESSEKIDSLYELLTVTKETFEYSFNLISILNTKKEKYISELSDMGNKLNEHNNKLKENNVILNEKQLILMENLRQSIIDNLALSRKNPTPLKTIELNINSLKNDNSLLSSLINETIKTKRETEQRLKSMQEKFEKTLEKNRNYKYGYSVPTNNYLSRYNQSTSEVEFLIQSGKYQEALSYINNTVIIIQELDKEIKYIESMEKKRQLEEEESLRRSYSNSWSSSSSIYDSSGGSSWGISSSSSDSGGGSSWDSGSSSSDSGGGSDW